MAVVLLTVIANRHPTPDLKGKWNQAASFHVVNEATTAASSMLFPRGHHRAYYLPRGPSPPPATRTCRETFLKG